MKKIRLPFMNGEIVTIIQNDDGSYPCPVCGTLYGSNDPPWEQTYGGDEHGNIITGPMAGGSFNNCACCGTQWGNDDVWQGKTMDERWAELRVQWLDRVHWNPDAMSQLKNLDIDPESFKKARYQG